MTIQSRLGDDPMSKVSSIVSKYVCRCTSQVDPDFRNLNYDSVVATGGTIKELLDFGMLNKTLFAASTVRAFNPLPFNRSQMLAACRSNESVSNSQEYPLRGLVLLGGTIFFRP